MADNPTEWWQVNNAAESSSNQSQRHPTKVDVVLVISPSEVNVSQNSVKQVAPLDPLMIEDVPKEVRKAARDKSVDQLLQEAEIRVQSLTADIESLRAPKPKELSDKDRLKFLRQNAYRCVNSAGQPVQPKCEDCHQTFNSPALRDAHRRICRRHKKVTIDGSLRKQILEAKEKYEENNRAQTQRLAELKHVCTECNFRGKTLAKLKAHAYHRHIGIYICEECSPRRSFTSSAQLRNHFQPDSLVLMDKIKGERHQKWTLNMIEAMIQRQEKSMGRLKDHLEPKARASKPTPHKCAKCEKAFSVKWRVQVHAFHHGSRVWVKPFPCGFCEPYYVGTLRGLWGHLRKHHDLSKKEVENIKRHYVEMPSLQPTPKPVKVGKARPVVQSVYTCAKCKTNFQSPLTLRHHALTHVTDGINECIFCTHTAFKTFNDLKTHLTDEHEASPQEVSYIESNQGKQNQKQLTTPRVVAAKPDSLEVCYIWGSYGCGHCNAVFMTPSQLKTHLQTHDLTKEEIDAEVDRDAKLLFSLVEIEEARLDVCLSRSPSFGCNICRKSFNSFSQFKNHLLKQHKLKPSVQIIRRQHSESFHNEDDLTRPPDAEADAAHQSENLAHQQKRKEKTTKPNKSLARKEVKPDEKRGDLRRTKQKLQTKKNKYLDSMKESDSESSEEYYSCIKCQKSCPDSQQLEIHLMNCIG